jgi:hypothetical protein
MTETERQFREELQELLNRYKDRLTTPQIMHIAQPIFTKTIGIRDNPERFNINVSKLKFKGDKDYYKGEWKWVD